MRSTQMLGALGTAAILLLGVGCANTADSSGVTATEDSQSTAAASPTTPAASESTEAPGAGAEAAETPAADAAIVLPPAPTPGTDAAIAWEALMSADGEYSASAHYAAVIDTFGQVEPYVSIREAEERHIAALIRQLERYGVAVPENPYLGNVAAPADLQTAAQAWATGEVDNVAMYDVLLAQTGDANLTKVLTNLRRASLESHLPTFTAAAENGGTLTTEQMNALPG